MAEGQNEDNQQSFVQDTPADEPDKDTSGSKTAAQTKTDNGLISEQNHKLQFTHDKIPPVFKREEERLKTFNNWASPNVEKEKLAAAGFIFLNEHDVVQCVFCKLVLGKWEKNDDPLGEHKRFSSNCPFLNGFDVGNVPAGGNVSVNSSKPRSYDTCGMFGVDALNGPKLSGSHLNPQLREVMEMLGISRNERPAFPEYCTVSARLKTYKDWPVSVKQKPESMAEAGFFYMGKGDQVVCFYCHCGLKDWEETDDPWVQHAKWSPNCSFLMMKKGKSFIDDVLATNISDGSQVACSMAARPPEQSQRNSATGNK